MSLLEWWGERKQPGTMGQVESEVPLPARASTIALYARGLVGVIFIVGAVVLLVQIEHAGFWLVLFAVYLALAYRLRVRPDYSNVGWMGGLIDHPFRWSDDVNRQLAFLRVVFMPGRFAVAAVRDAVRRARGHRVMVFKSTESGEDEGEG